MYLEKTDIEVIKSYKKGGNQYGKTGQNELFALIFAFKDSDMDCVEIKEYRWRNGRIGQIAVSNCIKQNNIKGIKIICRGDHLFLVKSEAALQLNGWTFDEKEGE